MVIEQNMNDMCYDNAEMIKITEIWRKSGKQCGALSLIAR